MTELKFYDLKAKKAFTTSDYKIVIKGNKRMAIATAPSGCKAFRIVAKE